MTVDPLDTNAVLAELKDNGDSWDGLPPETVLGHMHLHVANIARAEAFYQDVLGFELMLRYGPSASFLAAGGYHHHLGINTWAGVGASPPPPDAVGLRWFVINLPDVAELNKVLDRVRKAGAAFEAREEGIFLRDPSQNGMILAALQEIF
jgi:catechol 2,3-dioxygenase